MDVTSLKGNKDMNKFLICTPTYNRADMVEEVLTYEKEYYAKYNLDITYYDSSENNDTFHVIDKIKKSDSQFGRCIYYKKMDSSLCLDYKIIEIFKSIDTEQYEYIWFIADYMSITKEALDIVINMLDKGYDMIRLPLAGAGIKEDIECNTPQQWFENCSAGMAHMASTVMSTSLLKSSDIDWEQLGKKYIVNNELDNNHGYFFTVGFYLERIIELDRFKGIMIGNRVKWRRDCPLKKNQSYWSAELFDVWSRSYCETIFILPEDYKNKENVIRKSDNIAVGRFSAGMLARYKIRGIYDAKIYFKYKKYLPFVTNEKLSTCFIISILPKFLLKWIFGISRYDESNWEESLENMHNIIGDRKVIVYGAGLYGEKTVTYIKEHWNNKILGVAVTEKKDNMDEIADVKVYSADEMICHKNEAYVIIATLPDAARNIKKTLKKKGFRKYNSIMGY